MVTVATSTIRREEKRKKGRWGAGEEKKGVTMSGRVPLTEHQTWSFNYAIQWYLTEVTVDVTFGESTSRKSLDFEYESHWLWMWSLGMVQTCGGKYI
jgi:hypothetical protein